MLELKYCREVEKMKKMCWYSKSFLNGIVMYIHVHTKYTMNAGKIINRDIMLWHDEREKFNFAYLCKHDFIFKKVWSEHKIRYHIF